MKANAKVPIPSRSSGEISNRMFTALVLSSVGPLFAIIVFFVIQSLGFNPWPTIASSAAVLAVPLILLIPAAGFLLIIATTGRRSK